MKYFVAIKDGVVAANWGGEVPLSAEQIAGLCGGEPDEVRELQSAEGVPVGVPLNHLDDNYRLKSDEQLIEEGLLEPPQDATIEETETEPTQKELLERKAARNAAYVRQQEKRAKNQAIDELVAKRAAEILSETEKQKDRIIERAKARAEAYAQQAEALTDQNKESKN